MTRDNRSRSPADDDAGETEVEYDPWPGRLPSTSCRYLSPTTQQQGTTSLTFHPHQRVQRSSIPARRSALPPAGWMTEEQPLRNRSGGLFRSHPLVWVGFGMLVMLLMWTGLQALGAWWSLHQDDVTYGRPARRSMTWWSAMTKTPLEDDEAAAPPVIESQDIHTSAAPPAQTPPLFELFLLLLCLFVVGDLADTQLLALMTPTATITITPDVRSITLQSTATLGKLLSPITLTESQTVPATGHGHQDARQATGTLTFYSGQLQSVTVAVGTVLTGNDGIHIATTQAAIIPAADPTTNPPTFGQVAVSAQAVQVGASGNIAAFDVSGACCAASVLVKNLTPFVQGQDARDFLLVTKADRANCCQGKHCKPCPVRLLPAPIMR